jgi:hypothetical protein
MHRKPGQQARLERKGRLIAVAALAALGLSACDNPDRKTTADSRICTPFPEAAANANANTTAAPAPGIAPAPAVAATDPAAATDDCLHRWAYTLAGSTDGAESVAQATVAACAPALTRWNQQGLGAVGPNGEPFAGGAAESGPSLLTGQPTTPMAEHYNFAQSRALFYVVQARAGHCAAPKPAAANTAK